MKSQKFLWNYIAGKHSIYFWGVVTVLFTNMMQVFVTRSFGWILDFFAGKEVFLIPGLSWKIETFTNLFFIFLIGRILLAIGRYGWRITLARQTHVAAALLRRKLWEEARFFPKAEIDRTYTKGQMINYASSDVGQAQMLFGFTMVGIIDLVCLGLLTIVSMLLINVPLTLLSVAMLLMLPVFVRKLTKLEGEQYDKTQNVLSKLDDLAAQMISSVRLQRLTRTGPYWVSHVLKLAEHYRVERLKTIEIGLGFLPTMGAGTIISFLILFIVGTTFVIRGTISVGDFVAMQGLVSLLQDPLMELGWIISDWKRGHMSLQRLIEVYGANKDQFLLPDQGREKNKERDDNVIFDIKNLSFSYPLYQQGQLIGQGTPVLSNLNLTVKRGERLGLIGPVGSGKTTLLNILQGLERGHQGEVQFCGRKFTDYDHKWLRQKMAVVSQRPFLFATTIRENLALDQKVSEEELWWALKMADMEQDVRQFPQGLDTSLGEWGINLSGGQKQRLTLARALVRRPEVLIFDDCLSAVDTITEEKILNNINREMTNITLIWAAHRSTTLKYCDHQLQMEVGQHV